MPGGAGWPPYAAVGVRPPAALVVGLLVAAVALGVAGLVGAARALGAGWSPSWRRLSAAGLLAASVLALVPPIGSADPESYAAYGHIAATGHDPYTVSPAQAYRRYGDRVAAAAEAPWQDTTSVYGPVATGVQEAAARIGGSSVRTTVAVVQWAGALSFVLTGALLLLVAGDATTRRRIALGWWCNPLLLLELVAGAHVDGLVALGAVAAVGLARLPYRWSAPAAGVVLGLAAGVKLPALAIAAGLAWALRGRPGRTAGLLAGVAAALLPAYALAGRHALDQTRAAARYASSGTPWRWVASGLDHTVGPPASRTVLGVLAAAAALGLLWLLARRLPAGREPRTTAGLAGAALAGYLAYLLAAPYVLPWYDAPAWALLVLGAGALAARPGGGPYAALLLAHTGALAAAYLTRDQPLPGEVTALVDVLRSGLAPVVVGAVAVRTVRAAHRRPA